MRGWRVPAGVLAAVLACRTALASDLAPAEAERLKPAIEVAITNLVAATSNPVGLEDDLRIGAQLLLYRDDRPALSDNFLFAGLTAKLNPAFAKVGPSVEVQPLSVLNVRVGAELVAWFSSLGHLQSFGSPLDDWSDTALGRGKDAKANYATLGAHVTIEPVLQFRLGPVAMRNRLSIEYWLVGVRAGDTSFYEPALDTLVPARGWSLSDDLDAVYVTDFGLIAGARYTAVLPLYRSSDYRSDEDSRKNPNGLQRVGPILAYTFYDHHGSPFDHPTLSLLAGWYVAHRFRTGADVNQDIPYIAAAFSFTSDLVLKK
jgi:hypothetical protein